jgi:hypothetical protein
MRAFRSGGIGGFEIEEVQANAPLIVRVEEFGYLPLTTTLHRRTTRRCTSRCRSTRWCSE